MHESHSGIWSNVPDFESCMNRVIMLIVLDEMSNL